MQLVTWNEPFQGNEGNKVDKWNLTKSKEHKNHTKALYLILNSGERVT